MIRTTIMLPEDVKARAVSAAREEGISFGELIRRATEERLQQHRKGGSIRFHRARDPIFAGIRKLGVLVDSGPRDMAEDHDDYLYGKRSR